jgi:hypothetical protein
MSQEFLYRHFINMESLGIGFRRVRRGTGGTFIESTLVSHFAILKGFDGPFFNVSYETFEGVDVLVYYPPFWSSCSVFQTEIDCLKINGVNCGWCSLFEECMESK